jgi:hypothetical protein
MYGVQDNQDNESAVGKVSPIELLVRVLLSLCISIALYSFGVFWRVKAVMGLHNSMIGVF